MHSADTVLMSRKAYICERHYSKQRIMYNDPNLQSPELICCYNVTACSIQSSLTKTPGEEESCTISLRITSPAAVISDQAEWCEYRDRPGYIVMCNRYH